MNRTGLTAFRPRVSHSVCTRRSRSSEVHYPSPPPLRRRGSEELHQSYRRACDDGEQHDTDVWSQALIIQRDVLISVSLPNPAFTKHAFRFLVRFVGIPKHPPVRPEQVPRHRRPCHRTCHRPCPRFAVFEPFRCDAINNTYARTVSEQSPDQTRGGIAKRQDANGQNAYVARTQKQNGRDA